MARGLSQMYLTGPDVVEAVTGERITHEELGGVDLHGSLSGVATVVCDDEDTCFAEARHLLSLLPANNLDTPPELPGRGATDDVRPRLAELVPVDARSPHDMRSIITELVDDEHYFELHEAWAPDVVCVLARIDGQVVGIVGNQPLVLAGVLDCHASQKAARFVRFCDAFNVPLVTLVDVPGFLPGRYTEAFLHPQYAAEHGLVDDIIDPVDTRAAIASGLAVLRDKRAPRPRRKHGNVPL